MAHTEKDDFWTRIEQQENAKRLAIGAWIDTMLEMLPNVTEDRKILIRDGFTAIFAGPPAYPSPPEENFAPEIDAEFPDVPKPFFEEYSDSGITLWDFMQLAAGATHITRSGPNGIVSIWNYEDLLLRFEGTPADHFWNWIQYHRGPRVVPPAPARSPLR